MKELGVLLTDCPCLADDMSKLFDIYWAVADKPYIPEKWPDRYATEISMKTPLDVTLNQTQSHVFISVCVTITL